MFVDTSFVSCMQQITTESIRKPLTKDRILQEAKALFLREGFQQTSMRKIASKVGCSPTTIYLYFKNKSDITYGLHQEGFQLLGERLSSLVHVDHPFERLKAMGRIYLQFAHEHPDYYQLMFVLEDPMEYVQNEKSEPLWEEGRSLFEALEWTIVQCQQKGYFTHLDPQGTAMLAWSTVHGLSALSISGHFAQMAEHCLTDKGLSAQQMLDSAYQTFVQLMDIQNPKESSRS
jgi:AcrR family transcriptional regulator